MMRRSESDGCAPFMLASITRRHTAAVASSRKSLAASSTVRAVSSAPPSCFGASDASSATPPLRPKPWPAALPKVGTPLPNGIPLMLAHPPSSRVECGCKACVERRGAVLARLIKGEHAACGFDVEILVVGFQPLEFARRDAVILSTEEQQRHHRAPGEVQRFRQDQKHLAIL